MTIGKKDAVSTVKAAFSLLKVNAFNMAREMAKVPAKIYMMLLILSSNMAHAAGLFTGWRGAINSISSLLVLAATLVGIGAVLYGLVNLVKKGMGRGDDIEWREIIWPLGGGAMLTVLMYVVDGLVIESGASQTDMGAGRSF